MNDTPSSHPTSPSPGPASPAGTSRRGRRTGGLPPSKSLVVPLRDLPDLPRAKLQRILPGLRDAQMPLSLSECSYRFAPNGDGIVALVVRNEVAEAAFAADRSLSGLVPSAWALWGHCLRTCPAESPGENRAVLFADGGAVLAATGRGATFAAAAEVAGGAADVVRTLRMAFGADAAGARCICCGSEAASLADALRESPLGLRPEVPEGASDMLSCALAAQDWPGGVRAVLSSPAAEARRERGNAWCRAALGLFLIGLSVALFRMGDDAVSGASTAGKLLNEELTVRASALAGYPVPGRGDRVVALAKEAARKRDRSVLARMMRPGASEKLAGAMSALAESQNVTLFALRADDDVLAVSGNAVDEAAARAFVAALSKRGFAVRLEIPGDSGGNGVVRFIATAGEERP